MIFNSDFEIAANSQAFNHHCEDNTYSSEIQIFIWEWHTLKARGGMILTSSFLKLQVVVELSQL